MKQENFLYFGKRPTNVCYNGVSFPVLGGDVVRCYREFWEAFIPDERTYKVIPDDDPRKPKYKFGRSPVFIKPDPTGGLPVRSEAGPGANPRLKELMRERLLNPPEDQEYVNPYDLGVDENPALEMSTAPDKPSAPEPKAETFTTAPPSEVTEVTESAGDDEVPPVEEEVADTTEEEGFEVALYSRSGLRKMVRDEIFEECKRQAAAGCPHNPDFLEAFLSYDDESTRGVMFEALWEYCGYKNA